MRYTSFMNHAGKMTAGLAGLLVWNASLRADDAVLPGNPYAPVVARNIFGLNPPPVVDPYASVEPPVKITPNGIMSIYGQWQVLFKVSTKTGGKDAFYTLAEGQRQDDIEVTKIDSVKGVVTFNNHGLVQELALAAAPALTTPALPPMTPGIPAPHKLERFQPVPTRSNVFNAASQIPAGMTPEEQVVGIEVNRELTKQQVINGDLPPLPITDMTPSDATGAGGVPLTAAPPQ